MGPGDGIAWNGGFLFLRLLFLHLFWVFMERAFAIGILLICEGSYFFSG
nr:MAG TPA: hypothetical protein [Caudoviricetes sp.]